MSGLAATALVLISLLLFQRDAQSAGGETGFVPFDTFLTSVRSATLESLAGREGVRVHNAAEFERMKAHILSLYEGVEVDKTFILDESNHVDCINVNKQPSLRRNGKFLPIAKAPAPKLAKEKAEDPDRQDKNLNPMLSAERKDSFGNAQYCRQGFIPMRRVTLEKLVRYETVADFLHKYGKAGTQGLHRWAKGDQKVDNIGGESYLNLWKPVSSPGEFSLSQQWYMGGSGGKRQTVEGGWQVYPRMYNTSLPALFIFFTSDNYSTGCYNLDCRAFVQVNNDWVLGGALSPVSTDGGPQYSFRMTWLLAAHDWWLFLQKEQGPDNLNPIGYYPEYLFQGGQMTKYAQYIKFGGETAASQSAGQMGSGAFASAGSDHAAYQRNIIYTDKKYVNLPAKLSGSQDTKSCYTIDIHNKTSNWWATYFFFGGPRCPN